MQKLRKKVLDLLPALTLLIWAYCEDMTCQEAADREEHAHSGYNRRGSKDSQLR